MNTALPCRIFLRLRQVFWLPDHPLAAPSRRFKNQQWHDAAFVPGYSGGPAPDFNRIPLYASYRHLNLNLY